VTGTKQRGGIVGMTGDSISDAEALKKADIGICMGSGCDVAKDNADLVILDNNFNSIYRSIEWGRAIFDNVKKFLQFQITINIVLCLITVISGATLGQTPLNVIQMLWVNLMMDILGAIALGTEEPRSECDTKKPRISRKDTIIDSIMWRQILVMSAYQLLVMLILIFFGSLIFFETSFNIVTEPLRNTVDHTGTDRMKLNTILFYTFALMNLFNQINCRSLNKDNLNVFDQIHTNTVFILVLLIELTITYWMVRGGESHLLSSIIGTAPITRAMHITCWVLGASVLAVNIIIKKIPIDVFVFFAENVDLENTCKHDDPIN
jgi:Ca2+-transporting ATPase